LKIMRRTFGLVNFTEQAYFFIMKNLIALILVSFALTSTAHAVPVLLEKNYTNHAWSYRNHGCFIDENGFVYSYNVSKVEPIEYAKKNVGAFTLDKIKDLLLKASQGKFETKHAMADAGTTLYSGNYRGTAIKLSESGDYVGTNSAPETAMLIYYMDLYCPTGI